MNTMQYPHSQANPALGMTQPASAAATRTRIAVAALTVGVLLGSALPASAAWQHAHGDSANTGFARVDTDPADSHNPVTQLGPLAPGANPVLPLSQI
jgi:hypothetical protein